MQASDDVIQHLRGVFCNEQEEQVLGKDTCESRFCQFLQTLATPPGFTSLRLNTVTKDRQYSKEQVQLILSQQCLEKQWPLFMVDFHPVLSDTVIISNVGPRENLVKHRLEVVVDLACGMAVLRGADVFAQGIMGVPVGMQRGSHVSVFADLDGKCRKGLTKKFTGRLVTLGNGVACLSRDELFCADNEKVTGLGIRMTDPLYRAPSLSGILPDLVFAQNLPSIVCSHVLSPRPDECVLDMCAAPGGKTTHIATLMKNKGKVIALDKSKGKIARIKENADNWGLTCVHAYHYDATQACHKDTDGVVTCSPPFPPALFDRILLDAPCSALGQRPVCHNRMKLREVTSYPPLQRRLFSQAVELLKEGGTLVYSTCTVTLAENEGLVAWALAHHPNMKLSPQDPHLGGPGLRGTSLTEDQLKLLQRFSPRTKQAHSNDIISSCAHEQSESSSNLSAVNEDTIGFFIAKFIKDKTR